MAVIFIDGFDKYGPPGQVGPSLATLLQSSEYTAAGNSVVVAGLSTTGQAVRVNGTGGGSVGNGLFKTLSAVYATCIGGVRFNYDLGTTSAGFCATRAGNQQFAVTVNAGTGTISVRTGGLGNTIIATSSASVSANSTHYLEWVVTIGSAGTFTVYLDGVSILTGTGNTRGDGANNNFDGFHLGCIGIGAANCSFDDFYLFDATGPTTNAVLLTNPRIETTFPTGDNQTQFNYTAGLLGTFTNSTGNTNAPGANELFLIRVIPKVNCTINNVVCLPEATSVTAKFKAVIYTDNAGTATGGTLLSSGTEVVGCTAGTTLVGALVTPQSLTAGTAYWIGFITDTSIALLETDTGLNGQKAANTYLSGAPGTAPTMSTNQVDWQIAGGLTGGTTNWSTQNFNPPPGDICFISSSTAGNEDLYTFGSLINTPTTIYTVAVKAYARRTDTGARTIDLRTKSGGTDSGGSNTGMTPPTTYGWQDSYFDTDPNTGATWGGAALNSAVSGPKVAS